MQIACRNYWKLRCSVLKVQTKYPLAFEEERGKEKSFMEVFFAYFLFQKKVSTFSSVGRATDS